MPKMFTDGTALYYVVPNCVAYNNDTILGNTLVKVENINFILYVTHQCKYNEIRSNVLCRHVIDADIYYKRWKRNERINKVVYQRGKIRLQPDWQQIKGPDSVDSFLGDVSIDVTKYY